MNAAPPTVASGTMHHPQLGLVRYSLAEISDDPDTQVAQTISLMQQYTCDDAYSPALHRDVYQAWLSDDPITDTWRYLNRGSGIRAMRFARDEQTAQPLQSGEWRPIVDALIRPVDQATAEAPLGDCDDFAMYAAAPLLARGVPCSFVTVAADPQDPGIYSHVYLAAYPSTGAFAGQRVPLDFSHGSRPGWETENIYGKRREWPVGDSPANNSREIAALLLFAGAAFAVLCLYQLWRPAS